MVWIRIESCELPCGYTELNPGLLEEQPVLSTADPSTLSFDFMGTCTHAVHINSHRHTHMHKYIASLKGFMEPAEVFRS